MSSIPKKQVEVGVVSHYEEERDYVPVTIGADDLTVHKGRNGSPLCGTPVPAQGEYGGSPIVEWLGRRITCAACLAVDA